MRVVSTPDPQRLRSGHADLIACVVLAFLTAVFFGRVLFTAEALFWGDILLGFYPAYDLWKQGIGAGHLALWNPFILGGFPQAADASFGYFYPTILLHLFMPAHRALAVDLALHVFLAGVFTLLFLRRQTVSPVPALIGAVVFAFSGFLAVRVVHPPIIKSAAYLPLLLLIVDGFGRRSMGRNALYLGAALAAQLLAGHYQTLHMVALLLGCYALWLFTRREGRQEGVQGVRSALRRLGAIAPSFAGAILLAGLLSAAQLLLSAELTLQSDRSGGIGAGYAVTLSFPPEQLPMLLAPNLFGDPATGRYWGKELYWEMIGYAGVVSVMLAVLGAATSRRPARVFWAGIAVAGVALAMGRYSPLYWVAYDLIPGMSYFRVPARFLIWFAFAIAVLAAYGADALRSQTLSRPAWRWVTGGLIAGILGTAYSALDGPGVRAALDWLAAPAVRALAADGPTAARALQQIGLSEGRRVALLWTLGAGAVLAHRILKANGPAISALLLVLVAADLFGYGMNFYPTVEAGQLSRTIPTAQVLDFEGGAYRIITTPTFVNRAWTENLVGNFDAFDADALLRYRAALMPNTNVRLQIPNAYGYSPIYIRRTGQFLATGLQQAATGGGRSPLLDFVGAKYVFSFTEAGHTYQQAYRGGFYVWRNDHAMPRGWLATRYEVLETDAQVARAFRGGWDPRQTVILSEAPRETFDIRPRADPGRITRRSYGLSRVAFDLDVTGPAIFVLSDAYYPGWTAYVDGRVYQIYRANHAFRAVLLPGDARRLEFVYEPRGVVAAGIASGLGWLSVAALAVFAALRGKGI